MLKELIIKDMVAKLVNSPTDLHDCLVNQFCDVELKPGQKAIVYQVYFEYGGYCVLDNEEKVVSVSPSMCLKNSYKDVKDNVKTFFYDKVEVFHKSFTFSGTAQNPILKYILLDVDNCCE